MKNLRSIFIGNSEEFSVQHRVFNATLLSGIFLTIITGMSNFYTGMAPVTYTCSLISVFIFIGFYLYSLLRKKLYLISRVSFTYILFVFYPFYWFINGGSFGGVQYFSIFFLIILLTTMPGRKSVFIILYFITIIGLFIVEYFYPKLLYVFPDRADRYIDLIISYLIFYFVILIVLNIFMKQYREANFTLEKQKEELQIARKELETANLELWESNKTKDKFFSIIAHDLKSPFTAMLGFSLQLSRNYNETAEIDRKEYFDVLHKNINNTYKLLENLLVWSRSQRGRIDFTPEQLNLYDLLKEIINLSRFSSEQKLIVINNEVHPNITVYADRYMLSTIIRNLLSNAIKFTSKGGCISIEATQSKDGAVEICVIDNGVGISDEMQIKIFDISENTSTKGTENEKGTGLGLIICKEFVEQHHGKIWVESKTISGSKFVFTIAGKNMQSYTS